ncbi:hypothetical protein L1887_21163 [Cichorium endivia]|nr:hypothetical protein L1887_21163 [Cichorium endivia]
MIVGAQHFVEATMATGMSNLEVDFASPFLPLAVDSHVYHHSWVMDYFNFDCICFYAGRFLSQPERISFYTQNTFL